MKYCKQWMHTKTINIVSGVVYVGVLFKPPQDECLGLDFIGYVSMDIHFLTPSDPQQR